MLLSFPDSLIVSLTKNHDLNGNEQPKMASLPSTPRKSRAQSFGMDGLDLLNFTYKVSWPLELIANAEAINKYNQVILCFWFYISSSLSPSLCLSLSNQCGIWGRGDLISLGILSLEGRCDYQLGGLTTKFVI